MSTRETITVFCPNTRQEVIALIKRNPSISEKAEIIWEYDFVYCSGQPDCGKNNGKNCPLSQCQPSILN